MRVTHSYTCGGREQKREREKEGGRERVCVSVCVPMEVRRGMYLQLGMRKKQL